MKFSLRGFPFQNMSMTVAQIQSLIGTKIKLVSSTLKSIGEIVTFSNTGLHKVPYVLSRSQYEH
jgi:hypothetical protein